MVLLSAFANANKGYDHVASYRIAPDGLGTSSLRNMKSQYEKLRKRKPAGITITAIARKLLVQIYYTLKYD